MDIADKVYFLGSILFLLDIFTVVTLCTFLSYEMGIVCLETDV